VPEERWGAFVKPTKDGGLRTFFEATFALELVS
jgi:hypothetical protein